jgi:hypothetical protein
VSALDIIGFAGIATPHDDAADVVAKKLQRCPLLQQLASVGRLLVFVGQPDLFEALSESTNVSPTSHAIAAERLKREQKITSIEVAAKQKKEEIEVAAEEKKSLLADIGTARQLGDEVLVGTLTARLTNLLRSKQGKRHSNNRGRGRGRGRGKGKNKAQQ